MKSVLIRVIISLFLCCCLVLNVFSLPASATSVAVVAGLAAIPTAVAVACAFQALGVMSSANSTDFTTTVDNCSNWLTENSSFVVNGTVALLGLTQSGSTISYLNKSFIQDIWQWLFTSDSVSTTLPGAKYFPANTSFYTNSTTYSTYFTPVYRFVFDRTSYTDQIITIGAIEGQPISGVNMVGTTFSNAVNDTYNRAVTVQTGNFDYNYVVSSGVPVVSDQSGYAKYTDAVSAFLLGLLPGSSEVYSDLSVQLGSIESPFQTVGTEEETIQIEIAPIYIDWTKYGVPDPNDPGGDDPDNDGKFPMWLPTGIPSPGYDDSVITQNQQQAQSGVVSGDITFEPYEPSNPGSGNGSGNNTGTNTGTNFLQSLTEFFTPSGDITTYSLDLKDLFPFCIPFDIYDFLSALSADPVAPVFEFDLNLGVATESMKIDLSNWSDLAAIIRTLELGLFCVGLALKTRELIGG